MSPPPVRPRHYTPTAPHRPPAPPPPPAPPLPPAERFRPFKLGMRLRIIGLTLATVVALWYLLLARPGGHLRLWAPEPCRPGQFTRCVGGGQAIKLVPMAVPAQPATPAAPGASSPR